MAKLVPVLLLTALLAAGCADEPARSLPPPDQPVEPMDPPMEPPLEQPADDIEHGSMSGDGDHQGDGPGEGAGEKHE